MADSEVVGVHHCVKIFAKVEAGIGFAGMVEESRMEKVAGARFERMEQSLVQWEAETAVVEETADCWGIEEAYLGNQRMEVAIGVNLAVVENLAVVVRKGPIAARTTAGMMENYHCREEHRIALPAVGSLESPAVRMISKIR